MKKPKLSSPNNSSITGMPHRSLRLVQSGHVPQSRSLNDLSAPPSMPLSSP